MKIRTLAAFLAMVAGTVVATLYITGLNRPARADAPAKGPVYAQLSSMTTQLPKEGPLMVMMENMGESHEEAALHDEAAREKGVVVATHVSDETEPEVVTTMRNNGARHVQTVAGWGSDYVNEHPYPCDSAVKAR